MNATASEHLVVPDWVSRLDPPPCFEPFDNPVEGLPVGSTSKVGVLDVHLADDDGITRIRRRHASGPLCLLHPLYIDPGRPDMAFLYTIQLGGGLLQGDRYRVTLDCGPRTAVHLTSQAATKVYRMEQNYAAQVVEITAREGALVEYLPDPVIPFRGSRFYQRIRAGVAESATLILGEVLLPGRVARGEKHAYDLFHSDVEVSRPDKTLVFADRTSLAPPLATPRSPGRLGAGGVLATLFIVTSKLPPAVLADHLWELLGDETSVRGGVSELPNGAGVSVRLLGERSMDVQDAFRHAWDRARQAVVGVPAPNLRKDG
ncbi:urease accessory protein UreD [Streptomyces sp. NPDC052043]|uniref:urease accessory protein UreD n=1 Tax=Streptomyces sp. NPDC052043 TaxID=3365684 RepID=UPI0037D01557